MNESNETMGLHLLADVKIARIATVPYSIATQIGAQVAYFRDLGMHVVVICSAGPELERFPFSESLRYEEVDIPRSIILWKDLVAACKLYRVLRKYEFSIIHSTTPKAGLLSAVAGFLARVPIRLHTYTGQPWVNKTGLIRLITRFCDRVIAGLNTKCYADSASQRDFLIAEGIVAAGKIGVVGSGSLAGVDLKRFDPGRWTEAERTGLRNELGIGQTSMVLAYVGRISEEKGIVELVDAVLSLVHEGYSIDLIVIGPLDQERGGNGAITKEQIACSPRIHCVGYSDCPEKYLAISDVFCLPSYREGFGTVVIEAAAMGIPCVGTRIYGLTDAVVDGETGILVPPRDAKELKAGIRQLLDDPERCRRMGRAARERVEREFDDRLVNEKTALEYVGMIFRKKTEYP